MLQQKLHRRWWLWLLVWLLGTLVFHTACDCGGPGVQEGILAEGESGGSTETTPTENPGETITGDTTGTVEAGPEGKTETVPEAVAEVIPDASSEPTPEKTPDASFEPTPESGPEIISEVSREDEPVQEIVQEAVPEPTAPKVVATVPKDGEKVEQPKGNPILITVTFDQEMDPQTLDLAAFDIQPQVTGKVSPGSDGKSLEFKPDQDLPLFKKFTVTIKTSVKSKQGVAMAQPYTFSFETKSPGSDPTFLSTFSGAGGTSKDTAGNTHHGVLGHGSITGTSGGSGTHTVHAGFIHTFTY